MYHTWAAALPNVEVCPIQLPGRESRMREPPLARTSLLVDALVVAMRPYLSSPFAFYGHSMGAPISFELARRLIRDGRPGPRHLFVAARRAPQLRDDRPVLHTQPEPAFVEQVSIRYGALPKVIADDRELMRLFMPTLRAGLAAAADQPQARAAISGQRGVRSSRLVDWNRTVPLSMKAMAR